MGVTFRLPTKTNGPRSGGQFSQGWRALSEAPADYIRVCGGRHLEGGQ
jgi:hypothetical protein